MQKRSFNLIKIVSLVCIFFNFYSINSFADVISESTDTTVNTTVDLQGSIKENRTYNITNSAVYRIEAPINSSSYSISKTGNGTLVFNDTNITNFSADVIITEGTVAASNNNTLGSGTVRLNGGTLSSDSSGARSLSNAISVQASSELGDATNSGALTLSGNLDFTSGDLILSSRSNNEISGTVNLFNSNQTFSIDSSVTQTMSGNVRNGTLTKSGSGILVLSGTNTYTGDTGINAGTLNVSGQLNSGSYSGEIDNSGTFIFSSNSDQTLSGDITGSGTLTKSGSGTLTLSGANTYSGTTTISDGTLTLSGTLSDNTAVTVESGAIFDINNSDTVGSIAGAGTIDITSKEVLTVGGDNSSTIFSGTIQSDDGTGTGALTKAGTGSLTLSGNNNFGGALNVNAGSLIVSSNNALGSTNNLTTVASGATIDFQNVNYSTTESLRNSGTISTSTGTSTFAGSITLFANSTVDVDGTQLTLSGGITDSGSRSLEKTGNGILELSADNGYTGGTTITEGTLLVSGSGDLGTGTLTISSAGTLDLQNTLSVSSLVISGAGSGNRISNSDADGTTANLTVSGTSTLNGAVNTDGTQTYSGTTTLGSDVNLTGSTIALAAVTASGTEDLTITGNLDLNGDVSRVVDLSVSGTSNIGAHVTTIGSQTYSGATTLSTASILSTTDSNLVFSDTVNSDGTARNLTISAGTGTTQFAGIVGGTSGLGDIDITGALDLDAAISNASSVAVSLTSNIGADVTTTGTQTYTGATTFSASSTLTGSTVNFETTVDGGNNNIIISGNADIDGAITNTNAFSVSGAGVTSNIGADITTAGVQFLGNATLSGTGNRTVTSTGGSNITFYGITGASKGLTVDGGFQLSTNDATGLASLSVTGASTLAADVTSTGTQSYDGTTTLSSGDRTLTASTVTLNAVTGGSNALEVTGNLDLDGTVSGVTNMSVSGTSNIGSNVTTTGTQNYQGTTTLSGGDRILEGSTITMAAVTGTGSHDLTVTGNLDLDGAVTNVVELDITGTSNLGANVTTSGTQNYQGTTTLSGGDRTLQGSTITMAALTGGSNALTVTGNLDLDGAVSGVTNMSVSGTSNIGADVTTTGTQSYTGTTTVSASSTLIGTEISAAAIALNDDLEIRNSSDSTLASVISGTGALTKSGSGALTLRGVNTFDGDLTVSAGTLYAGLAADSGNQVIENNVTVSGGTLSGGATIGGNVTVATANLAPGNSIGTLTIDGNVTLGDNSTTTIEFNDTTSDKVVVSGNITLAGALVLEPANTTYSDATLTIFDGSGGSGNSLSGTFASTTVSNSSYLGDATTSISYDTVNRKVFLNIDEDGGVSSNTVKSLTTRNKFKDIAQIFDDATAGKILEVANVLKSSDANSVNTELNKTKGTLLANSSLKSVSNHQFYQKALDNIVSTNTTSSVSNFTQNNLADLTLDNLQSEGLYGEKASYNDYYDFSDQSVLGFIKNNKNRTLLSRFSSEDRSSFLRTYGTSSENENIGADYTGYKSDTYGVLFGQQFKDSDKDFYGYAYGFSGTDIDYNNDYGETNAYTLHTSVFKQVSDDDYNLNLKLGGYLTNRQNERKVSVFGTSVDDIYKSETTDLGLQAGATYLRKYNILGLNLSPSISLSSTYEFKDDIDEEGGSLALKVDNENLLTIKPEVGFSLDKNFSTIENITNQFSFAMFASEDHYLEGTTASAKFATSSNFNLDLPKDKDQFLAAGLGYNFLNSESGTSLMANLFYTQNTENDYEGNLFSFTFRKLFGDFGRGRIPAVITEKVDEQKEKVVKIILPKVEKEEETIVDTVRRSLALLFQKQTTSYRAYKDIYENFDCKVLEDVRLYQSLMYLSRPQVVSLLEKCDVEDENTIALVANRLNDIRLNDLTMFEILKKNYYYSLIYLPFITFIAFVILMYELFKKGYFRLRRKP